MFSQMPGVALGVIQSLSLESCIGREGEQRAGAKIAMGGGQIFPLKKDTEEILFSILN